MNANKLNFEEIQDEHLDTLIRLAFKQRDTMEAQELITERDTAANSRDDGLAESTYARFQEKLAVEAHKETRYNRLTRLKKSFPKAVQIAACMVLMLGIATPFAIANVEAIRVKVMQLLVSIEEDHAEIELVEDEDASFYVPAEWRGGYFPSYIPEGYEIIQVSEHLDLIEYRDSMGNTLAFGEYDADTSVSLDSENGKVSYADVNGYAALVIETKNQMSVTWSNGAEFFVIHGGVSKEELLAVAKSVQKISRIFVRFEPPALSLIVRTKQEVLS